MKYKFRGYCRTDDGHRHSIAGGISEDNRCIIKNGLPILVEPDSITQLVEVDFLTGIEYYEGDKTREGNVARLEFFAD